MILVEKCVEGDIVLPAREHQKTKSGQLMGVNKKYMVSKVYQQSPFFVILKEVNSSNKTSYVLGPKTAVRLEGEALLPERDVLEFEISVGNRKIRKILAYRVNWDGKIKLSLLVSPQGAAIVRMLHTFGKNTYSRAEALELWLEHKSRFYSGKSRNTTPPNVVFSSLMRTLTEVGLIEEICSGENLA